MRFHNTNMRVLKFQFQCGTIKSQIAKKYDVGIYTGFNSNVVRLKVVALPGREMQIPAFQFQCGTIKSLLLHRIPTVQQMFQFQCGTIKRVTLYIVEKNSRQVSIPMWYD